MRMIVDAFKDTLELGLEKPKQVVVRFHPVSKPRSELGGDTNVDTSCGHREPLSSPFGGIVRLNV
jgi:hypothetical protein